MSLLFAIVANALLLGLVFLDVRFTLLASRVLGNRSGLGVENDIGCQSLQLPQLRFSVLKLLDDFSRFLVPILGVELVISDEAPHPNHLLPEHR
jgi:hypothetical protein